MHGRMLKIALYLVGIVLMGTLLIRWGSGIPELLKTSTEASKQTIEDESTTNQPSQCTDQNTVSALKIAVKSILQNKLKSMTSNAIFGQPNFEGVEIIWGLTSVAPNADEIVFSNTTYGGGVLCTTEIGLAGDTDETPKPRFSYTVQAALEDGQPVVNVLFPNEIISAIPYLAEAVGRVKPQNQIVPENVIQQGENEDGADKLEPSEPAQIDGASSTNEQATLSDPQQ